MFSKTCAWTAVCSTAIAIDGYPIQKQAVRTTVFPPRVAEMPSKKTAFAYIYKIQYQYIKQQIIKMKTQEYFWKSPHIVNSINLIINSAKTVVKQIVMHLLSH